MGDFTAPLGAIRNRALAFSLGLLALAGIPDAAMQRKNTLPCLLRGPILNRHISKFSGSDQDDVLTTPPPDRLLGDAMALRHHPGKHAVLARIFGVVVACLCKAISMLPPRPQRPSEPILP